MTAVEKVVAELKSLEELIVQCSRCGTCQSVCPLYKKDRKENAVARGKMFLIEALYEGRLEKAEALQSVRLQVSMPDNATLAVSVDTGGTALERRYPVEAFPASERPLTAATLEEVFSRTAGEPFALESLEARKLPPLVIPPSRFKEIRRDLYRELRQVVEQRRGADRAAQSDRLGGQDCARADSA